LHRTPTAAQQARWEAVQYAKEQGLSLRAISRTLGIAKNTVKKYMPAESPPTKKLSAKEHDKAEGLAASLIAADKSG
jgi:transposase